jgi:hypothetical protein
MCLYSTTIRPILFFHFLNVILFLSFNLNIMRAKYFFISIVSLILLSACGQAPVTTPDGQTGNAAVEESENDGADYLGSWIRTATYVGGELMGQTPATLTFKEDGTYTSVSADCANSGTYTGSDGSVTMVMTANSCPGNIMLPFTVVYTYVIEKNEDGDEIMTITTADIMVETYIRKL